MQSCFIVKSRGSLDALPDSARISSLFCLWCSKHMLPTAKLQSALCLINADTLANNIGPALDMASIDVFYMSACISHPLTVPLS